MTSVIDELKDITKSLGDGALAGDVNFKEINSRLTDALADVAHHIEDARKNLLDVRPGLQETTGNTGHLGDIDKTLADAADGLFTLTEKAVSDNERSSELLTALKEKLGDDDEAIAELLKINSENKGEFMEMMTGLSFQDLAGQKIKKINELIEGVETRILKILVVMGYANEDDSEKKDAMLENLSGEGDGLQQNTVDDILKDFGL